MPTLMQKIRLVLRGWQRRRQERDREFLQKNAWTPRSAGAAAVKSAATKQRDIDMEGLTVAYLDGSGRAHYLDTQTGDIIESSDVQLDSFRYKRIPSSSHEDDRRAFIDTLDNAASRSRLSAVDSFRTVLAGDRTLERAWYNFRNNHALTAIEHWLREIGMLR